MDQSQSNTEIGIFKILMLGKRRWSSNIRILCVYDKEISYYGIPKEKKETLNFLSKFNAFYEKPGGNLSNQDINSLEFIQLGKAFAEIQDICECKGGIKIEEMEIVQFSTTEAKDPQINPKNYLYPIMIKQKADNNENTLELYKQAQDKNSKNNGKDKKNSNSNNWLLDFYDKGSFEKFKKLTDQKRNALRQTKLKVEDKKPQIEEVQKVIKEDKKPTETQVKKEEEEKDVDVIFFLYIYEYIYQYMLKNYFSLQSTSPNKKKFEMAILQINSRFRDLCTIIVKKIIHDMGSKPITTNGFIPIVFTAPRNFKKSEQAVFIYYIHGINFHVTWHQASLKMKNDAGKIESEKSILNGAWYHLDYDFKNRDLYNELLLKYHSKQTNNNEFLRVPLSCVIEYYGFKVYCESDIYIDDGKYATGESKRLNTGGGQGNNALQLEENSHFYKELLSILVGENKNISSIKDGKENAFDPIVLHTSNLTNFLNEYKRMAQISHSTNTVKSFLSIYYNQQFRDIEHQYLNETLSQFLITVPDGAINNTTLTNNENDNNTSNINALLGTDNQINNNKSFHEFFLKTIQEKDAQNFKYVMDLKILIEIRDKSYENKKIISDNFPKRNIYFRPEFLIKYFTENVHTINVDDHNDTFIQKIRRILCLDENNVQNYQNVATIIKFFRENYLNNFINSLDTFFLKPYDSATLTEAFHSYGINMFYLGHIAELTNAPHIRELCMIEMVARIIKKMISDLMSLKWLEKANDDFYMIPDLAKTFVDLDIAPNEQNMLYIPVAFQIKYHKEYLKKIQIPGSLDIKYMTDTKPSKGIYKKYWYKGDNNSIDDKNLKNLIIGNSKVEDKNQNSGKPGEKNDKNIINEINKELAKFFNVLFNFEGDKYEVTVSGVTYKNSSLWKVILDRVKSHFMINNDEILRYFDPCYISLPALLNAIQHLTGINVTMQIINNTKYSNRDLINYNGKEFTEDQFEIKSRAKTHQFRNFIINRDLFKTNKIHYNMIYTEELHKYVVMRYINEKVTKTVSVYSHAYFHYMNLLRKMENDSSLAKGLTEVLLKLDLDSKEKYSNQGYDFYKTTFNQNTLKFESLNYCFLAIVEPFTNKEEVNPLNSSVNITTNKLSHSTTQQDFLTAQDYISEFWFSDHPFLAILNLIIARLQIKTSKHVVHDEKIDENYKRALQISKKSLGPNNIFVANLCEEIGRYFVHVEKYYEGVKHFTIAHYIFRENKDEFFECYIFNLKKIVKYFIILGYYKEALEYGFNELVPSYQNHFKKNEKDRDTFNYNNDNRKKLKFDNILLNLIYVAKTLSQFETGVELCKILVFESKGNKPEANSFFNFKDWRRKKDTKLSSKIKEKEYQRDIEMRKIISLYLRLVIRNLKSTERAIFIQSLVKVIEDKNEKVMIEKMLDNDKLYSDCFSNIKEEGDLDKYFKKILNTIGAKYDSGKSFQKVENSTNEIDKNYNDSWVKFRNIYKLFNQKNIFTDKDKYN